MLLSMPGPSSSARGAPVDSIGSPRYSPEVSSYTWTNAVSPSRRMISPISFSLPTRTMSYIRAPARPRAMTAGPEMRVISPVASAMYPSSPEPAAPRSLLLQLHGKPDVLLHQPRDVGLAGLQFCARRGQRHDHRQFAVAQDPRAGVVGAPEQILVDDEQPVPGGGVLADQPERVLGRGRLAHFHPGQAKPGRGFAVRDDGDLIHSRAPRGRGRRAAPAASHGRSRAGC